MNDAKRYWEETLAIVRQENAALRERCDELSSIAEESTRNHAQSLRDLDDLTREVIEALGLEIGAVTHEEVVEAIAALRDRCEAVADYLDQRLRDKQGHWVMHRADVKRLSVKLRGENTDSRTTEGG